MIKVGAKYAAPDGKNKYYRYPDVKRDEDGWADATKFLPADYDLCRLKIKDRKSISGWHKVNQWDGVFLKDGYEVLYWKRIDS